MPRCSISTAGRGVAAGPARVVAVFSRAAYVRGAGGGLFALTVPGVPPGPIHAETRLPSLRIGDDIEVDLTAARRWEGTLPPALDADRLLAVLGAAPRSTLEPLPAGDLAALTADLGGRGPGLTPAGDDCLAGFFLVASLHGEDVTGLAASVPTNDVARAFLHWAARGQSIEPVHRLLCDPTPAALADLLRIGHTSGADLALGIRSAVQRRCNGAGPR